MIDFNNMARAIRVWERLQSPLQANASASATQQSQADKRSAIAPSITDRIIDKMLLSAPTKATDVADENQFDIDAYIETMKSQLHHYDCPYNTLQTDLP